MISEMKVGARLERAIGTVALQACNFRKDEQAIF
jgi:hypothetical protein